MLGIKVGLGHDNSIFKPAPRRTFLRRTAHNPHQGNQEKARRLRQIKEGKLQAF